MNWRRISQTLNRVLGGRSDQTFCAAIAEAHGTDCRFCRLMSRWIEPAHCKLELARWQRRGTSSEHVKTGRTSL